MLFYTKQNRILNTKVGHGFHPIDKRIITNHINSSTINKLTNKIPSDRSVYSSQNPYGGVGDAGTWVRNPNCWINGVTNISCFSPAQRSGANWWQRGGTLITRKHALFAKHFVPAILPGGGTPLIFVDENNNAIRRNIINYGYDTTDIAVALLDQEVPSNIKIAKVLPINYRDYIDIAQFNNNELSEATKLNYGPYAVGLDQEEKAILKWIMWTGSTSIDAHSVSTLDPYTIFTESIITGDSGNPVFLIIDNELVVLTTWLTSFGGPFVTLRYNQVNAIIESLSPGQNYSLTPVDLDSLYNKLGFKVMKK
jgi:hypothetical protein